MSNYSRQEAVGSLSLWDGRGNTPYSGKLEIKISGGDSVTFNVSVWEKKPEWNGKYLYSGKASFKNSKGEYVDTAKVYMYTNASGQGDHEYYVYLKSTQGKEYSCSLFRNHTAGEKQPVLKGKVYPKETRTVREYAPSIAKDTTPNDVEF